MGTKGQGTHILWSKVTQISKLKQLKKIETKFHMNKDKEKQKIVQMVQVT